MIDRLGRVIFESDTNNSLSEIKAIVSKIRDHVKRTAKPPTGNQNCQLCTWCTEAHMRGFDVLPRPVYSPRDPVFNIKGESIVKNPIRQSLGSGLRSGIENLLDLTEIEGGRWYCHVNWYSSQGGHEFILMRINKVLYVVDSQQGLVTDALSKRGGEYFNDIKWGNSYIVRLDDKEFNEEMFMKNNDPSQTLPWDEDLDIPYMRENGMLPDEDINEAKVERINDEGDTVPEKCDKCGSHVGLYLKGEPVWLCSNKKCGKYFGTAPCNFQEAATLKTVDMSKMKKIYYWSPIRLAPDPDQGDIITIEHDSSKIFVTDKIGLCPFYTLYDSEIFENIIKKYNADIVPVLPRNLDELSKEENIVVKLISSEAKPKYGDFTLYVYEVDKSSVSNIVNDKKYKSEYLYAIPRKNGDIIVSAKPVKVSKVHYTIKPELSNTFQESSQSNKQKPKEFDWDIDEDDSTFTDRLSNKILDEIAKPLSYGINIIKMDWDINDISDFDMSGIVDDDVWDISTSAPDVWGETINSMVRATYWIPHIIKSFDQLPPDRQKIHEGYFSFDHNEMIESMTEIHDILENVYRTNHLLNIKHLPYKMKINDRSALDEIYESINLFVSYIKSWIKQYLPSRLQKMFLKDGGRFQESVYQESVEYTTVGEISLNYFGKWVKLPAVTINSNFTGKYSDSILEDMGVMLPDLTSKSEDIFDEECFEELKRLMISGDKECGGDNIDMIKNIKINDIVDIVNPQHVYFEYTDTSEPFMILECKCNIDEEHGFGFLFNKSADLTEMGFGLSGLEISDNMLKKQYFQESTLPDGVFLRPANESDLPNIIKWKLESVNPKTRNDPKTIRFIENDAKENLKDTKMIMSYSTVIGVLESCYIDDGEWWYIGEIYLIPEYRGKGIARVILQQEIDSHDKLKLRVSKDNTHAIDLYKSLGFGISEEDEYAYTMTLVKDNIQESESSSENFDKVLSACKDLYKEWSKYDYGIPVDGRIQNIPSASYFDKNYRFLSPEEFKRVGGGVCWDYVEFGAKFLNERGIKYKQLYIITDTPPNYETHTIIVCEVEHRVIYVESSFKKIADEIGGVGIFNSIEEVVKYITSVMFELNGNDKHFDKFAYDVIEFTSVPKYGSSCQQYMQWMQDHGEIIYQGIAYPRNKNGDKTIQEGAWNDLKNGVNPYSTKRVFHVSREGHLDGQVFKPRVPEYLDKYDPNYPNFEDVDNPRVCFSPSIEGCLNAMVVNVERWKADRFDKLYVYVPEKPIDQYKHTTNKQIIKDKKVYDANLTREVWIEEPVRLKMYGVIKVDQISDVKKKSTVPMLNGKKGERNYYSYKWHWLIKPKVLDKVPYDYSPTAVCEDMVRDLKRYAYGIPVNGKVQNVPSSEYFDKHYRLLSPDEFEKYGGGVCWDYVEFMEGYLDAYGYSCKKYYISTDTKDGDTHTFITVDDGKGGLLYPESSFKLIEGLHKVKNVEEAIKMITSKMFEVNNNSKKYSEIKYYVWEYTGHPEYGSNSVQCTEYFSKGEPFYEGTAINPNKQKIVKESVRMSYPDRFGDNSGLLTRTMERDSDVYMEAKVTPEQAKANREENLRLLQYDSIKRTIVIDGPDGSPIKVKASIGKYDVYGIDPINTMAGKKSIYAASNKNGDAYIRIPPSYLEKDPKYLQPLIAHEAEHVNQINNNKRKHGDMIGGISPRDSESVIKYTRKFIDKHSRQLNNHDKLEAELLADFHAATKFGRKAYSKALRKLTYYGLSLKEFRKARIDTYEDDSPVVKLYRSGETSVDKYIKAAELQIAKFERLKKNCEAIVSLSKDDQGKFDVIGLGGTRVEISVHDQCETTLIKVNILMDSAKAFLERLKSHESDVIDDSIKAECKQINTQIKILSSKIVSLPTLVANITSTELRIKFLKQIMKDKPWLNDSIVSEFFTVNGFDDFDVDNFYLEADEDIDENDDEADLDSFGSDNDGSSPNNQYDEEEVSRLNELISDENHAVGQYFEAAKTTNNEVLRRLFSDIGSEERFHTEQLLYAKSTITGEKYEPLDKDVKKEYEELLAMGMDEEDAFNTAIDKQHLNDEDDGDDSDMEDLAVDTKAIEESFIYFNDILSLAEIITESDLYESSSELMKSVSFIMETALYMEEVGPADQPKSFLKNNPITVLIKGFISFIKFINGLVDKIKLFINKIQTKQRRMHDWIKKNGIKALFENGVNLYFYNEDDRSVQASAILYADMLTRLVKMIGLEMNINFTPRKKFNVDNNHAVEFNSIDHGLRKFKEVVFSKTKVVVTDNNEAMLAATFFGYNTYKNTEGKSVNIYNVLENVADAVKVISEDTSKFIEHVKNLDRDLNSIYYKDRKKYMLCVEQLKQVYKGLTIMGKALASDMNEILKLNNGLLEKTRAQDKIDMGIDPNNP